VPAKKRKVGIKLPYLLWKIKLSPTIYSVTAQAQKRKKRWTGEEILYKENIFIFRNRYKGVSFCKVIVG